MQPLAIHHVSINVNDVEESLAFYTGALGAGVRSDRPDFGFGGAWLDVGAQQVHLIEAPVPPNVGQHFAIQVADLAGVIAELRSKGLAVEDPVQVGADRQAFLADPDGNRIELHEVGSGA
jgi:glyoxylase I family protein